jgi:choline/glycine/proline betaine transport protein
LKTAKTLNPPVFFTSAGLLLAVLVAAAIFPSTTVEILPALYDAVAVNFGWFYILSIVGIFCFILWLVSSRYASLKLGKDDDVPSFSTPTWFAMLFSAGMGIGLVFYGVAEPMLHYASPPTGVGGTPEAKSNALALTFHHWGFHAWAIYALLGLAIAYFAYRQDLPLTLRSCFQPLLGDRVHGWIGHWIDILAVIGTLFGLATSLGLGAMSVSVGFNRLFGLPHSTSTQLILIAIITAAATLSLVTGVHKGIRRLSEASMVISAVLLVFVFTFGPTLEILHNLMEGIGVYLSGFVERSFRIGAHDPAGEGKWVRDWTVLYWGWWISWAPFVGMFAARISRGRTIREFILGVLLVPTAVTFVWFGVLGGAALALDAAGAPIAESVTADQATAVYAMLAVLPWPTISSFLAAIVVIIFFVSSSDSASYVVDMLTSGGNPDPPLWQRVFWATAEGATAGVLLYAGGEQVLKALQAGVVSIALPFCLLLVVLCFSLAKGLRSDPRFAAGPSAHSGERSEEREN